MAKDNMKHRRLQELDKSDFEIVEGQPDIRGWDVKSSTGETIGEVEELILDAQARKVRYMVVELDDDALDLEDDREVLIPIGIAQLHEEDDDVLLPNVTTVQLLQLPEYDADKLDDETERAICSALGRSTTAAGATGNISDDFYAHDHFNETNLYQRRLPQSSTAGSHPDNSGMRFRERNLTGDIDSNASLFSSDADDTRRMNREEVEEDSLLSVNSDRSDIERDLLSIPIDKDRNDSFNERDSERRNREGSRGNDDTVL